MFPVMVHRYYGRQTCSGSANFCASLVRIPLKEAPPHVSLEEWLARQVTILLIDILANTIKAKDVSCYFALGVPGNIAYKCLACLTRAKVLSGPWYCHAKLCVLVLAWPQYEGPQHENGYSYV